jgi:uncharacterized protein
MMGELDAKQIDEVLRSEILGRIGCVANGWPYIVPVTYVYDGEYVYVHSAEGMKLRAMHDNPLVCFEVEQIRGMSNWRTVVMRGHFEDLGHDDEERAMGMLEARLSQLDTSASAQLTNQEDVHRREGFHRPVLFRIRLEDRSGRFELS